MNMWNRCLIHTNWELGRRGIPRDMTTVHKSSIRIGWPVIAHLNSANLLLPSTVITESVPANIACGLLVSDVAMQAVISWYKVNLKVKVYYVLIIRKQQSKIEKSISVHVVCNHLIVRDRGDGRTIRFCSISRDSSPSADGNRVGAREKIQATRR